MSGKVFDPVFYDKGGNRSRYSRRILLVASLFLAIIFSVTLVSVLVHPVLPVLELISPHIAYRGAPNAPRSANLPPRDQSTIMQRLNAFVFSAPGENVAPEAASRAKVTAFYVNWDDNSFTSLKENIQKFDVLMPEWLHLADGYGGISIDDPDKQRATLDFIRTTRPDLRIVPLINNFNSESQDWDGVRLVQMLASSQARVLLEQRILEYVRQNKFAGISIDFESLPPSSQPALALFMKELSALFRPLGLEVSQSIPLDDPDYNAKILGAYADYLILMAYDENSVYAGSAGPVSSQDWYTEGLTARFRQLPPEKYLVALGGYGYDWRGQGAAGEETTFESALQTAEESEGIIELDPDTLNPTYSYYDDRDVLHRVWFLDAVSAFDQMVIAQKLGRVGGYAFWRLGSEDPTVWNVFSGRDSLDMAVAQSLETLAYGYDISYEGTGEVFKVTSVPREGKRAVNYDPATGLILGEQITVFPSPYVITRWGGGDKKKIALSFDDGPSAKYTPKILDILKNYDIPGTFFVVGVNANIDPDILRRIVDEGNEVGSHTYTHPNITTISEKQFAFELNGTERLFEGILGRKSLLFRPPYAEDIEPASPEQIAPLAFTTSKGYYTVGMHIDPRDWSRPGAEAIVRSVINGAEAGSGNVVLLHDGGGDRDQTVAALPKIIDALQARGYELVTVSDLLGLTRDSVMPPVSRAEQWIARVNGMSFLTLSHFGSFLKTMFLAGIALGILRFCFIGYLAFLEWLDVRWGRLRKYRSDFIAPTVAVVIPAYNEEAVIVRTVQAILGSSYPQVKIIVLDDGSTDRTLIRLQGAYTDHPDVSIYPLENRGKARALNFGIAQTDAEIIITLDADTLFRPDTITKLIRRFADRRVAAVAGNAKVGNRINLLTRWQALEYITSQNLDRRAFEMMNCIAVVPGAVGAWRRSAILEAGGFSSRTLAEDADLTFSLLRNGHRIAFDDEAIAFTEAPDTVKSFIKQRFRWMYGTFQTAWQHRDTLFRPRYGALGFFAVPNVFIFQVFFPLISPLMDLTLIISLAWVWWQKHQHPVGFSVSQTLEGMLFFYFLFLAIDFLTALLPFLLERGEQKSLLLWLPLQRFFYRQLMYYVAIKATGAAIKGKLARWGKLERHATVTVSLKE